MSPSISLKRLALGSAAAFALLCAATPPASAATQTYVVLFQQNDVPASATAAIGAAGGTVVASYKQIGVAIVASGNPAFGATIAKTAGVQGAASTGAYGVSLRGGRSAMDAVDQADAAPTLVPPASPAPGGDALSGLQWDMDQISAPAARAINGGSPAVVVGVIDTGIDYTHPDLAPNIDFGSSASCIGGIANPAVAAWNDDNGHGTHTAGTIGAAKNGIGIVGVAPNVKLAAIKAGDGNGFFFPEAVICAFVWAGTHNVKITNNSYFADPWLFNCRNDPGQRAIWEAERRAIRYAMQRGVVVVAAMGNQADDLAHPTMDATSPDDTTPVSRDITNACAVVPTEIAGVVGVSANGNRGFKSYYSSYGVGSTQVVAPGGDVFQRTAAAPNGLVLSTWPAALIGNCARRVIDPSGAAYCYLQGTSMASPHAAGVAALIASAGVTSPGAIAARLANTADAIACPIDLSFYAPFPAVDNGAPQQCQGGAGNNGFYGHGQINALSAVSK